MNVGIREIGEGRGLVCNGLLRSLPRWFGIESAIQQYVSEVERMPTFVAYNDDAPIGFVSLKKHNEWTAEVYVMAVHPEFHRKGIGRKLLAVSEECLRNQRFHFLSVKTIGPSSSSAEYELTRKFYQAQGFKPVEEIKALWSETNPCLLMLKVL
jgi:ribosomal protein S18 acetylase RimI-like enzyme